MPSRFLNNIKINDEYSFPNADGSADQIIKTDGAGQLSFVDQSTISAGNAEHVVIYAKNTSGSQINKGTPVYITGTVGATDTVAIAPADAGNSSHMPAVGLLDDTLLNNEFGYVITGGFMDNITTDPIDGAQPASNDTVYVKAGGGLTLTKPTGPTGLIQNIAKVGKVSGGNSGSLIVSSILRTNDVPNLTTGKIWVGSNTNTTESTVVHLDETNGRMGIGTTSPAKKLTIGGIGLGNTDGLKIEDPSNTAYGAHYSYDDGSTTVEIGGVVNNALRDCISIARDATRTITIDTSERVGIGTTSPRSKLHVQGVTGSVPALGAAASAAQIGGPTYGTLFSTLTSGTGVIQQGRSDGNTLTFPLLINPNGGNVGIGTTNPSQRLEVNGDAKFTGRIYTNTGELASVGILGKSIANGWAARYDSNDANYSGFFFDANNDAGMVLRDDAGNMNVYLRSDSTSYFNGGNVGIGTNSPSAKLEVEQSNSSTNTVFLSNSYNNKGFRTGNAGYATFSGYQDANNTSSGNAYGALIGLNTFYNGTNFYNDNQYVDPSSILFKDGNILFHTNDISATGNFTPNERLRITKTGNVGIGTTSPNHELVVQGASSPNIELKNSNYSDGGFVLNRTNYGQQWKWWAQSSHMYFGYSTNESTYSNFLIVRNNGNVGIGAATPSEKLHIYNGKAYVTPIPYAANQSAYALKIGAYNSTSFDMGLQAKSSSGGSPYMSFRTTSADDVLVVRGGNVGIGTASPQEKLHVQNYTTGESHQAMFKGGAVNVGDYSYISLNNGYSTEYNKEVRLAAVSEQSNANKTGFAVLTSPDSGGASGHERLRVTADGNVGIGTTSPSEKLEVNGSVKATATTDAYKGYIKQNVISYGAEKVESSDYYFTAYNTTSTVTTAQPYNRIVAAYSGRVKKVYIRNAGGATPTATAVNFKKHVNGTTSGTVYAATVANTASANMTAYYDFADSDFTFNAGDLIGLLYQTTDAFGTASKTMGASAITITLEYNIT